ncbi:glycosyltransferase family 4 protein [Parasediminibacterium sp. JCM 36343]|uniref:glycosyltransferase family 4 protein n=1 Tax=Parasediminibacterium sp. JCM 36343 TaxID=3374279 RepID=UPI00397E07B3
MKIILIGNYKSDEQESMIRFAEMLLLGLTKEGVDASIWSPTIILGHFFANTKTGIAKWVGYIDKWLLFPAILKIKLLKLKLTKDNNIRYHICDHSNSMYYQYLPKNKTSITCHDVLAIKGSLGYKDAYCTSTKTGKYLQQMILRNLVQIPKIACVSTFTLNELTGLAGIDKPKNANWLAIPNSFNNAFAKQENAAGNAESIASLEKFGIKEGVPFVFHVGTSHERKNRQLLIKLLGAVKNEWGGVFIFAGEALNAELMQLVEKLEIQDRIIDIGNVTHQELVTLYSNCFAFIFPSFSEGFGWPIIEAQACEAPVITSNLQPMKEVAGEGAALFANPHDLNDFKLAFEKLNDSVYRDDLIQKGKKNIERYSLDIITKKYIQFFNS